MFVVNRLSKGGHHARDQKTTTHAVVTDVRFLGSAVAVMHASGGTMLRRKSSPARARDSIQALVAVKHHGAWQLVAFQNTRVRPIGRNVLGTLLWLVSDWLWKWCLPRKRSRP
jgi:hypothetical protein